MLARVNPFSSDRLLRVRHRLTGLAWPDLLSRLRQMNYRAALVVAFVAVLMASYWPARRAARLAPVDVLRGSGQ